MTTFTRQADITTQVIYSGFSERLNTLIDMTTLDAPIIVERRAAWLAKSIGGNKATVWHWYQDEPPRVANKKKESKTITLYDVIHYLLDNIPEYREKNVMQTLIWVLYGENATNPFDV